MRQIINVAHGRVPLDLVAYIHGGAEQQLVVGRVPLLAFRSCVRTARFGVQLHLQVGVPRMQAPPRSRLIGGSHLGAVRFTCQAIGKGRRHICWNLKAAQIIIVVIKSGHRN